MNYITPDIEVKNAFQKLENAVAVNELTVAGFNLYGVCRFILEMNYRIKYFEKVNKPLINKKLIFEQPSPIEIKKVGLINKIKNKFVWKQQQSANEKIKVNYYAQFDKLEDLKENVDILFVATSSFKNSQNYSIELEDVIKHSKLQNKKIAFVLPDYDFSLKRRKEYNYFYSVNRKNRVTFDQADLDTINTFKALIKKNLALIEDVDLIEINEQISSAISLSKQLERIIDKAKPSLVVARSLYSDKWVVMACHNTKTACLEVQHGVFTSNNFYYHSLSSLSRDKLILPDYIACLGVEWFNILCRQSDFWNKKNAFVIGSPLSLNRRNLNNKKINVLIAFQDFGTEILDIRVDIIQLFDRYKNLDEFSFTLRIHPANTISELGFKADKNNFILSNPKTETVLSALEKADVLICATSMMLYEALSFNIPVISFERFRLMTQENGITFVNSTDELYNCLKEKTWEIHSELKYIDKPDFRFYDMLINN